jgi:hypothetical protein
MEHKCSSGFLKKAMEKTANDLMNNPPQDDIQARIAALTESVHRFAQEVTGASPMTTEDWKLTFDTCCEITLKMNDAAKELTEAFCKIQVKHGGGNE